MSAAPAAGICVVRTVATKAAPRKQLQIARETIATLSPAQILNNIRLDIGSRATRQSKICLGLVEHEVQEQSGL